MTSPRRCTQLRRKRVVRPCKNKNKNKKAPFLHSKETGNGLQFSFRAHRPHCAASWYHARRSRRMNSSSCHANVSRILVVDEWAQKKTELKNRTLSK
jgi:hypothetical protein